ncbi:hypothetical protein [Psychrobacter pygoscelis]|uniref:hypothetical protein n=1 Tax=Psychrobacter pygoscelis TaxID=2488563 RepID=UPI00103BA33B|nr:hypothetical protein [Psychrobacter pygoscelis]
MNKAINDQDWLLPLVNSDMIERLILCEQRWFHIREHMIARQSRMVFWFGDNSRVTWLLALLISYVISSMLMMLVMNTLGWERSLRDCALFFVGQGIVFLIIYTLRAKLAQQLQQSINKFDWELEQILNDMYELANVSILPDIHSHAPLSLTEIGQRYHSELQLTSLQLILKKEIEKGRMLLNYQDFEIDLPPEFAESELIEYASNMIYKSLL